MISTNDFKTGMTIELDGELYTVLDYDHVKPGKGGAFLQTDLKNIETGAITNHRFRSGEKVAQAHIEGRTYQFLYRNGDNYVFMDNESYEQIELGADKLGVATNYLKENLEIEIEFYENKIVGVKVPNFVELAVAEAPPAIKGNTVTGGSKKVTLESGAEVKVPLFIEVGDILKIDTRSGDYIERV